MVTAIKESVADTVRSTALNLTELSFASNGGFFRASFNATKDAEDRLADVLLASTLAARRQVLRTTDALVRLVKSVEGSSLGPGSLRQGVQNVLEGIVSRAKRQVVQSFCWGFARAVGDFAGPPMDGTAEYEALMSIAYSVTRRLQGTGGAGGSADEEAMARKMFIVRVFLETFVAGLAEEFQTGIVEVTASAALATTQIASAAVQELWASTSTDVAVLLEGVERSMVQSSQDLLKNKPLFDMILGIAVSTLKARIDSAITETVSEVGGLETEVREVVAIVAGCAGGSADLSASALSAGSLTALAGSGCSKLSNLATAVNATVLGNAFSAQQSLVSAFSEVPEAAALRAVVAFSVEARVAGSGVAASVSALQSAVSGAVQGIFAEAVLRVANPVLTLAGTRLASSTKTAVLLAIRQTLGGNLGGGRARGRVLEKTGSRRKLQVSAADVEKIVQQTSARFSQFDTGSARWAAWYAAKIRTAFSDALAAQVQSTAILSLSNPSPSISSFFPATKLPSTTSALFTTFQNAGTSLRTQTLQTITTVETGASANVSSVLNETDSASGQFSLSCNASAAATEIMRRFKTRFYDKEYCLGIGADDDFCVGGNQ